MSDKISEALRAMIETDPFAKHLGAKLLDLAPGHSRMELHLGPEHGSVPGVTHGGVTFALAEAALAAATHAHNLIHLALSVNVVFHASTKPGDKLIAEVRQRHGGKRTASYSIEIQDQNEKSVASLQAMVYRTQKAVLEE
ncbi:PaaI family thioesterase [Acidobacteriota bacterium]